MESNVQTVHKQSEHERRTRTHEMEGHERTRASYISKKTKASVVANLCRMGSPPERALSVGRDWVAYQTRNQLDAMSANPALRIHDVGLGDHVGGRFYSSAHFGPFPWAVVRLGQKAKDRLVFVVMDESGGMRDRLSSYTAHLQIQLRFVDGVNEVDSIRRALDHDYPVFMNMDMLGPSGSSGELEFPLLGGFVRAHVALFDLIRHVGCENNFLLPFGCDNVMSLVNYGALNYAECMRVLESAIKQSPHQYERLVQLHDHYRPARDCAVLVHWQDDDQHYALHADTMQSWRVDRDFLELPMSHLRQKTGLAVDHVVSV